MVDLILKFTDEHGVQREVKVASDRFSIGRTSDNDLTIVSGALSRKHVEIMRYGDVFIVTDANSSNGTLLNGKRINEPIALKNADKIILGDTIKMLVEISGNEVLNHPAAQNSNASESYWSQTADETIPFWQSIYFIASVFGVIVLLLAASLIFILNNGRDKPITVEANHELPDDEPEVANTRLRGNRNSLESDDNSDEKPANRQTTENTNEKSNSGLVNTNSNAVGASGEDEKVEGLALQFLRRISDNQNPVLNSKQVALINAKIKLLKNSVAFRDNLRAAGKNAASFEKTGQAHNLKGAFLAAAALAKLGDARGDAAATAAMIAPDLQKYALVLGTELANDNLLAIAAYAEGNPPNAMRDRVANLTLTPGSTAIIVRTIWFLHDNGKLNDSAFDFAVRFVAAGTILQNPSAFNL